MLVYIYTIFKDQYVITACLWIFIQCLNATCKYMLKHIYTVLKDQYTKTCKGIFIQCLKTNIQRHASEYSYSV